MAWAKVSGNYCTPSGLPHHLFLSWDYKRVVNIVGPATEFDHHNKIEISGDSNL